MELTNKKEKIINYIEKTMVVLLIVFMLLAGLGYAFNMQNLFMDSNSYKELLMIKNTFSDAIKESHGFIVTEYTDKDGVRHTESLILGKFEPELHEDTSGVSSIGLNFSGYVFFLGRDGEIKNHLYVKRYENKAVSKCFDGVSVNQSLIVNALVEGIDADGILLSDSVCDMCVKLPDELILNDIYGKDVYVDFEVTMKSKWALFGRTRSESDSAKIMNRVKSIRVPYIDGYFYFPAVNIGEINTKNNMVSWNEYYSEYDEIE